MTSLMLPSSLQVKDFLAAEALSELERDWLAAEGKLLDRDSAPIRTVANQTDDQVTCHGCQYRGGCQCLVSCAQQSVCCGARMTV